MKCAVTRPRKKALGRGVHSDAWRAWATPFERHKAGVLLGTRLKAAALAATLCLLQQHQLGGHHAVRHRTHMPSPNYWGASPKEAPPNDHHRELASA